MYIHILLQKVVKAVFGKNAKPLLKQLLDQLLDQLLNQFLKQLIEQPNNQLINPCANL